MEITKRQRKLQYNFTISFLKEIDEILIFHLLEEFSLNKCNQAIVKQAEFSYPTLLCFFSLWMKWIVSLAFRTKIQNMEIKMHLGLFPLRLDLFAPTGVMGQSLHESPDKYIAWSFYSMHILWANPSQVKAGSSQ